MAPWGSDQSFFNGLTLAVKARLSQCQSLGGRVETNRRDCASGLRECVTVLGMESAVPGTETPPPAVVRITGSTFSLRIMAATIILLVFYYAAGLGCTVLLAILLAYFLDPAGELLERMHLPRTLGATAVVLLLIAVLAAVGYGLWARTAGFAPRWPESSAVLKQAAAAVGGDANGATCGLRPSA